MSFKYISLIFIDMALVMLGFSASGYLRRRVKALEELLLDMHRLRALVVNYKTPLGGALRQCTSPLRAASAGLSLGIETAFERAVQDSDLSKSDTECVMNLARSLKGMSHDDADGVFLRALRETEQQLDAAKDKLKRDFKLYITLGLIAAGVVTLFLI